MSQGRRESGGNGRSARKVAWMAWGASDVGRRRTHNEDSFVIDSARGLFVVADGMGGHAGGQEASRLAVDVVCREVHSNAARLERVEPDTAAREAATVLSRAATRASAEVHGRARRDPTLDGMGTTMTALLLTAYGGALAHVGDSRAYLVRDGAVLQLSEDHSLVQEQVRLGLISREQARTSRLRNVITRSVGVEESVVADLLPLSPRAGDRFLICSDGLSNYLEPYEVVNVFRTHLMAKAPEIFVDLANERGGADNITAIAIFVCELED